MFAKFHQDEKTREWNTAIQRYISLHKYIKEVGKISIAQARSGPVDTNVQSKLADALRQTDTALYHLKQFFKPCLTTIDVTDLYPQEKLNVGGEKINREISELKHENESLRQKLSVGNADILEENQHLKLKLSQLTEENKNLRTRYAKILNMDENVVQELINNDNQQIAHLKRLRELEETLKTQNNFIYNLKQQLLECERDRDIFKSLNRTLEMELRKTQGEYPKRQTPEAELRNESDYLQDYFTRSTLKIGEYNAQMESWKHNQNFVPYFQMENDVEKRYGSKFKSLQEIPRYPAAEKTYLKSKSYDNELDDTSFTFVDYAIKDEDNEKEEKKEEQKIEEIKEKADDLIILNKQLERVKQDERVLENGENFSN